MTTKKRSPLTFLIFFHSTKNHQLNHLSSSKFYVLLYYLYNFCIKQPEGAAAPKLPLATLIYIKYLCYKIFLTKPLRAGGGGHLSCPPPPLATLLIALFAGHNVMAALTFLFIWKAIIVRKINVYFGMLIYRGLLLYHAKYIIINILTYHGILINYDIFT